MFSHRMLRHIVASLALAIAVAALTVQAQPPAASTPAAPAPMSVASKQLLAKQQDLLNRYKSLTEDLLTLAHRLEKSQRVEDQDKAKLIRKAIEVGDKEGVDNKFRALLRTLGGKEGSLNLLDLTQAKNENEELVRVLQAIYEILNNDDEMRRLREEKMLLEQALRDLKALIAQTEKARSAAELNKGDAKRLAKEQEKNAKKTAELAKRFEGKEGNDKEPKDAKDGNSKDGMGKDGKGGMGKDGMGKDGKDGKGGMGKDGKGGMGKDGKGGMGKDGKGGMGKEDGKGGMGKDGKGGMGGMGGMGGEGGQSSPSQQSPPKVPGADQVRKAVPDQEQAKQNLDKNKRDQAAQNETDAIKKLEEAKAELEKRLKQLREEELERLLANLEARVAKMYQMQVEVYQATKAIDALVQKNETKKPEKADIQKSQSQADKESEIVVEANKAIDILKQEGSAVAFPRVFEEVVIDMIRVRERLNQANVGQMTQDNEKDIIDVLKEMLEALKKAQQDLQKAKSQPPGAGGPPPDQKLLDEIAELKMIRNLQVKVNEKTKRNAVVDKHVVEQIDDPQVRVELKDLASRQVKIEEMARDLATGKNK